jgi:transposase
LYLPADWRDTTLERWNAGCYTAMRLFRDLRQRGYAGGYGVVAASARRLRQAQGLPPGHRRARQLLPAVAEPACQPLTPRRATWLVLRRAAKRTEAEAQQLLQLHAQGAEIAEAIDLAQDSPRWSASGSRRSSIRGCGAPRRVRSTPCDASLPGSMKITRRSKRA